MTADKHYHDTAGKKRYSKFVVMTTNQLVKICNEYPLVNFFVQLLITLYMDQKDSLIERIQRR